MPPVPELLLVRHIRPPPPASGDTEVLLNHAVAFGHYVSQIESQLSGWQNWAMNNMDLADKAQLTNEQHIDAVLQRMFAQQHLITSNGICIDCKERINPARLQVLPDAQRCIDCQNFFEKNQGK